MFSMYEKLMALPLFKGASTNLIQTFAEKTPLMFSKYSEGQTIVTPKESCNTVKCLLSGSAVISHPVAGRSIWIHETVGPDSMIGIERLFGLDTTFSIKAVAGEECSLMEFSKKIFIQLLQDHQLLMINYINYLCRNAQKPAAALLDNPLDSPSSFLAMLVALTTSRESKNVEIEFKEGIDSSFVYNDGKISETISSLVKKGVIRIASNRLIKIISREDLCSCL